MTRNIIIGFIFAVMLIFVLIDVLMGQTYSFNTMSWYVVSELGFCQKFVLFLQYRNSFWITFLNQILELVGMSGKHVFGYIFSAMLICVLIVLLLQTQNTDFLYDVLKNKGGKFMFHKVTPMHDLHLRRDYKMRNVDCKGVIEGNKESLKNAKLEFDSYVKNQAESNKNGSLIFSDQTVSKWAKNCEEFVTSRKYITSPINSEEAEYPIAYMISIYNDLQSFENLLRAIYRPQNVYCIHVDQKSLSEYQTGVLSIIKCFNNVFLATHMTKVWYTHWTIVQASLNCMEDLVNLKEKYPWKYAINLCGHDLPSKTNLEIVRGLKNISGRNEVFSESFTRNDPKTTRYKYIHAHQMKEKVETHASMESTGKLKEPAPHNIQIFKGSNYFIFKREAIEYMLTDTKIKDFFEWSKDTMIPDEMVWATLQRMYPQFPGSNPQDKSFDTHGEKTFIRSIIWFEKPNHAKCDGSFVRIVCVYGLGELNWIVEQKQFFANKFFPTVNIFAINCLLEWQRNSTLLEYANTALH